jgi:hypothetical protein
MPNDVKVLITETLVFSRSTKGTFVFQNPIPNSAVQTLYIKKGSIDDKVKRITIEVSE